MQDGIYHVQFASQQGIAGEGLAVIKSGSVNGGDAGYLYIGQLLADGDKVSGQLQIKRWNTATVSIFGPLQDFKLDLSGTASGETFTVAGGIPGHPNMKITITLKRLAAAA